MTFSKKFYDALPLIVFAATTLIGGVIIVMSKMAGLNPLWTMAIPVLVMFVYLGLSLFLRRLKLHDEQTGDNLYYMGFLFTLTSLGTSLYQFDSGGSMDDVVRNFGVAITSTIFGIGLRILFNQTRRDIQDIEYNTRHQLSDAARLLLQEMNLARREFTEYRRINIQMINEGFDEIVERTDATSKKMMEAVDETTKKMTASLDAMTKEALKPIQEASTILAGSVTESTKEISTKLGNISTMLDSSATKIQNTAKRIDKIQLPSEVIKNDLAPVIEKMGDQAGEMTAKFEATVQEQAKIISDLTSKFEGMTNEQTKVIGDLTTKFDETRTDQGKVTKEVTDTISQMVEQMKLSISHMEKIIEASMETVDRSEVAVKAAGTAVAHSQQAVGSIELLSRKTDQIEEKVEKSVAEVRSIKDILNRVLSVFGTRTKADEEKPAPAPVAPEVEVSLAHTGSQTEVLTARVFEKAEADTQAKETLPESAQNDTEGKAEIPESQPTVAEPVAEPEVAEQVRA